LGGWRGENPGDVGRVGLLGVDTNNVTKGPGYELESTGELLGFLFKERGAKDSARRRKDIAFL
jgi:hypothetical protein